jgi:hypothetical protein
MMPCGFPESCPIFCDEHLLTTHVFKDNVVWERDVEIFHLENHQAVVAYAWSYKAGSSKTRYVAVLGIPPVYTAVDAVRTYLENSRPLAAQSRKKIARTRKLLDRTASDVDSQTADIIELYQADKTKSHSQT